AAGPGGGGGAVGAGAPPGGAAAGAGPSGDPGGLLRRLPPVGDSGDDPGPHLRRRRPQLLCGDGKLRSLVSSSCRRLPFIPPDGRELWAAVFPHGLVLWGSACCESLSHASGVPAPFHKGAFGAYFFHLVYCETGAGLV